MIYLATSLIGLVGFAVLLFMLCRVAGAYDRVTMELIDADFTAVPPEPKARGRIVDFTI